MYRVSIYPAFIYSILLVCLSFKCGRDSRDYHHKPAASDQENGSIGSGANGRGTPVAVFINKQVSGNQKLTPRGASSRSEDETSIVSSASDNSSISSKDDLQYSEIVIEKIIEDSRPDVSRISFRNVGTSNVPRASDREYTIEEQGEAIEETIKRIKASRGIGVIDIQLANDREHTIEEQVKANDATISRIKRRILQEKNKENQEVNPGTSQTYSTLEEIDNAITRGKKEAIMSNNLRDNGPIPSVTSTDHASAFDSSNTITPAITEEQEDKQEIDNQSFLSASSEENGDASSDTSGSSYMSAFESYGDDMGTQDLIHASRIRLAPQESNMEEEDMAKIVALNGRKDERLGPKTKELLNNDVKID